MFVIKYADKKSFISNQALNRVTITFISAKGSASNRGSGEKKMIVNYILTESHRLVSLICIWLTRALVRC